jgi:hypothetical protein
MAKYLTIVIRADDEPAARQLVPGEKIGPNSITACSLGDALSLNDKFKELISDEKLDEAEAAESESMAAFFPVRR